MQILREYNTPLISEIALKCGDPEFNDFNRNLYSQSVLRSQRTVAAKYDILERRVDIKIAEGDPEWVTIPVKNFKVETKFLVNDIEYKKNTELEKENSYMVRFSDSQEWSFNYTEKTAGDVVSIRYTSLGETSDELDGTPILPDKYYEELIRGAIVYMAEIGKAKFKGEKKVKYDELYQMYKPEDFLLNPNLIKNNSWVEIKPYDFIGD